MKQWVIFDLDGTLVESEQIWEDVRREFAVQHRGRWHDGAQRKMMGMRTGEWSRYMHEDLAVPLEPDEIAERVVQAVAHRISKDVPVLPGAGRVLTLLAKDYCLGLATSATRIVADAVLARTGWNSLFAAVVSADEVARGKPAPDVYLRAAELLQADRSRTAAIEDSANGIRSAHAAQLTVIAIPNRAFPPDRDALSLAVRVLKCLDELRVDVIRDTLLRGFAGDQGHPGTPR
jgi:HAD superfamily hydrolase (TIGR01509 family)